MRGFFLSHHQLTCYLCMDTIYSIIITHPSVVCSYGLWFKYGEEGVF